MAYTAWSVVFGEQPTAAKWNQLGENDAGFKDGSNIDNDAILLRHIKDYEEGSNANGTYTKYPNGDLIQKLKRLVLSGSSGDQKTATWTFPTPFDTTDYALLASFTGSVDGDSATAFATDSAPSTQMIAAIGTGTYGTTSVALSAHRLDGMTAFNAGDTMYLNVLAIGKWM